MSSRQKEEHGLISNLENMNVYFRNQCNFSHNYSISGLSLKYSNLWFVRILCLHSPQRWGLGVPFCAPRLNSTAVPLVYYKPVPFSFLFVLFFLLYNFSICFRPVFLSFLNPFCLSSSIPGLCQLICFFITLWNISITLWCVFSFIPWHVTLI